MKILPTPRIYDSLTFELGKPRAEVLEILRQRAKSVASFVDGDTVLQMYKLDGSLFFTRLRIAVAVENTAGGNSKAKFDLLTRFPANLKVLAAFVTLLFLAMFIALLSMGNLSAVEDKPAFFLELIIWFLKFMLTLPVLAAITYLNEMVNRYTTRKFVQRLVKDL